VHRILPEAGGDVKNRVRVTPAITHSFENITHFADLHHTPTPKYAICTGLFYAHWGCKGCGRLPMMDP